MKTLFLHRVETIEKSIATETLVVFLADDKLIDAEFDQAVTDDIERNLWPDQVLLLVRESAANVVIQKLRISPRLTSALDRLPPTIPIAVSAFGLSGAEVRRQDIRERSVVGVPYDSFKNRIVTEIFIRHGGLVRSTPAYHFKNPSQRHTSQFMRLSNALVSWPEISFIAFCTLPYVPESASIAYVDTSALFGLVSVINSHRLALGAPEPLLFDSFGSYEGLPHYKMTRADEAVVLISASSSGGLAALVRDHERLLRADQIAHIVFLGLKAEGIRTVCNLARDKNGNSAGVLPSREDYKEGACPICDEGSIAIALQGEQFDFAGPQPNAIEIASTDAPKPLMETTYRIVGSRALQVGLGGHRDRFPRQFAVDSTALLATQTFKDRLSYIISRSVPASISVIVALDEDSMRVAQEIRKSCLASNVEIVSRDTLRSIPTSQSNEAVVIAAAAIESGRSLQDISRDLRSTYPAAPQVFIIGLVKATSEERLRSLRSSLIRTVHPQQHELVSIETLILPASVKPNIWTRERDFLERALNLGHLAEDTPSDIVEYLRTRVERLGQAAAPLVNELFMPNDPVSQIQLQPGFVFWQRGLVGNGDTQADVYFTIASVLQALRANSADPKAKALRSDGLQHTLLSPSNFGRFNDGVVQAALLRAAYPHELNYASSRPHSAEMGRILRRILEGSHRPRGEAAAEFIIAMAVGQLSLNGDDYAKVMQPINSATPLVRALQSLCIAAKPL
jgi:hypothetical protein